MCAVCGTVWCGFGGVSVCCVWESLVWVCGSECVLCVGQYGVGLWERVCAVCRTVWYGFVGVSVCCVWGSLVWVWESEFVLCVGQLGMGLWE